MSFRCFSLLLVFLSITLIVAKTSPPGPTVDCSDPKDQLFRAACKPGDHSQCCGMGTGCCAGGCCNPGDRCVGQGTSEEGCCSISDLDFCGVDPSVSTLTTSPTQGRAEQRADVEQNIKPDVPCGVPGFEKTFYCPHGTLCNIEGESCDSSSNVGKSSLAKVSISAPNSSPSLA